MTDQREAHDALRVKFDIVFAIAVLLPQANDEFPLRLHRDLAMDQDAERIWNECIDPGSTERTRCKIRADFSRSDKYQLNIGTDTMTLFPGGEVHVGGSGVTIEIRDRQLNRDFALKVPRVSTLAYIAPEYTVLDEPNIHDRFRAEYNAFENERRISRRLSHQNVAQHFFGHRKPIRAAGGGVSYDFPFSVSEWIGGARKLHEFLDEEKPGFEEIVELLRQSFSALEHIHSQQVLHWDIKSDNVLVSGIRTIKLIDFGNAKLLDVLTTDDMTATTTKGKYPQIPVFREKDTGRSESRRFRITMPHLSWNHQFIDLWMLCQEWNRCVSLSNRFSQGASDLNETKRHKISEALRRQKGSRSREIRECLVIVFERVLFPFQPKYVKNFVGGDDSFNTSRLYYEAADQILIELSRIQPPFGAGQNVPELLTSLDEIVRLPVTGNSVFTSRVAHIVNTKIVQPTMLHLQLAQVRQVFPGATHTRFEHLLGTLTTASYFIRSLYLNDMNTFWRVSADEVDIRAVLLAAILHDSGHMAFGHFIEEMNDLVGDLTHTRYMRFVLRACLARLNGLDAPTNDPNIPHFRVLDEELEELVKVVQDHWCEEGVGRPNKTEQAAALVERATRLFESNPGNRSSDHEPAHLSRAGTRVALNCILKSIIDGPIDADKLDYLRRDSLHAGVFFSAGIDLERFFESLRACVNMSDSPSKWLPAIGVSEKGIAPLETVITARYHLYSTVYWHRTVRCITAILQRVISEVRLALPAQQWVQFIAELVDIFRRVDDRQALEWLEKRLEELGLLNRRIANVGDKAIVGTAGATMADMIGALNGQRNEYFPMAFELSYVGPIGPEDESKTGRSPRERLHDQLCQEAHPPSETKGSNDFGLTSRTKLAAYRHDLEKRFENLVTKRHKSFVIDTILLDVPEPGKDQLYGLLVDRRSKRSRRTTATASLERVEPALDFIELAQVSPIAATLADVFGRWARKIRIFMAPGDLVQLEQLGLEPGDIAALWEEVLYEKYNIAEPRQYGLRGVD